MSAARLAGLGALAGRYDAVLFDQFGVLHDGRAAFPGAVEAVRRAKAAGLGTAVISNSGKRAGPNARRLDTLGFAPALFDAVVTSGEVCHARLAAALAEGRLAPGAPVRLVARDGDLSAIAGLDLHLVGPGEDAALVIVAGREPERFTLEAEAESLAPLARRGVACWCSNPDRVMYAGEGTAPGPGALAAAYAGTGGPVTLIGKPGRAVFEAALDALGVTDPARALMVGDSVEHDVAGARAVGIATLLVTGGIQAAGADGPAPDHEIERLAW
ncbi:MAG: TIGR01459 family HAD-type hydrolase [Paracoccaceae bacterium]